MAAGGSTHSIGVLLTWDLRKYGLLFGSCIEMNILIEYLNAYLNVYFSPIKHTHTQMHFLKVGAK